MTPSVVLIPTGELEHRALRPALERLFPGAVFEVRPAVQPLNGFTSTDVSILTPYTPAATTVDKLAVELVSAVLPSRHGSTADFAYVIEDLELKNDRQPDLVVQVFRDAIVRHIDGNWPSLNTQQRVYATVRARCSFHLLRPMTEAYFFGEPAALTRAGAASSPQLVHDSWEEFLSSDTMYLGLPKGSKPVKDMPDRQKHPKSYLHYLCDPTLADRNRRYKETKGGVAALTTLAWQDVMTPAPYCPFLHALLDDLADALQIRPAFVQQQHASPLTRFRGDPNLLLRNV